MEEDRTDVEMALHARVIEKCPQEGALYQQMIGGSQHPAASLRPGSGVPGD
jgi:hypothetical protein